MTDKYLDDTQCRRMFDLLAEDEGGGAALPAAAAERLKDIAARAQAGDPG